MNRRSFVQKIAALPLATGLTGRPMATVKPMESPLPAPPGDMMPIRHVKKLLGGKIPEWVMQNFENSAREHARSVSPPPDISCLRSVSPVMQTHMHKRVIQGRYEQGFWRNYGDDPFWEAKKQLADKTGWYF